MDSIINPGRIIPNAGLCLAHLEMERGGESRPALCCDVMGGLGAIYRRNTMSVSATTKRALLVFSLSSTALTLPLASGAGTLAAIAFFSASAIAISLACIRFKARPAGADTVAISCLNLVVVVLLLILR